MVGETRKIFYFSRDKRVYSHIQICLHFHAYSKFFFSSKFLNNFCLIKIYNNVLVTIVAHYTRIVWKMKEEERIVSVLIHTEVCQEDNKWLSYIRLTLFIEKIKSLMLLMLFLYYAYILICDLFYLILYTNSKRKES